MSMLESESVNDWIAAAGAALDEKTKPVGSLGELEEIAKRLCGVQKTLEPSVERMRLIVFAGDHGVAAEGVSAYPSSVTGQMVRNFATGGAAVCVLARAAGAEMEVVDVGVAEEIQDVPGIVHVKVRAGTRNFLHEPAMTPQEVEAAMEVGRVAVRRAATAWVDAIGLGEMGIANSTAASALLSALTGIPASRTVGSGTGVSGETLEHKRRVVERALFKHRDLLLDPLGALGAVGGLELAAIAGAALEAPKHSIAVVVDGFISTVAVLAAARIDPSIASHLFFAHRSAEKGHDAALDALSAKPVLDLGMRLGEGSGAALALPILRAAARIMCEMATFRAAGVSTAGRPA
jgi:nicotinate-nucleotide--dimethylbenzimidazole phosphoribosyltransferase